MNLGSSIFHRLIFSIAVAGCLIHASSAQAPRYDLLIRNGHIIDPRNGLDGVGDVAVLDGRIERVEAAIPVDEARRVIDAQGLFVSPGLIDIHAHVFYGMDSDAGWGGGFLSLPPDGFTFRVGVTTVVDAGGTGWRNFRTLRENVIERSRTRVLALLNIVGSGMQGNPIEQNLNDMDPKLTAIRARQHPETIVGVKLAHYDGHEWEPVIRAVEAGRQADIPVMVDFGRATPVLPLDELFLKHLRPGDIFTHTYADTERRMTVVDTDGQLRSFIGSAEERGILFDVGHGGGSFAFNQAVPALRQGFLPFTISTDLHTGSMNAGMKDLLNVMSKFLNLGLSVSDVVRRTTWNAAQAIKRNELGHLSPGAPADLAILRLHEGDFGFVDVKGGRLAGRLKLECELTLRDGEVVWDLNGLASADWDRLKSH